MICSIILFCSLGSIYSQEVKSDGPVIFGYGHVWDVPKADYPTDTQKVFKLVFDIHNSPDSPSELNPQINTLARFLNMHVRHGVPKENLRVVAVFHNKASKDLLQEDIYRSRYGNANPNYQLLNQLADAGVAFIFCGQSSYTRDIPIDQVHPNVALSLSAITAIVQLTSDDDYTLIKF